eukprot:gene33914-43813_t
MGCTGSKKFSANTLEPTQKNPAKELNQEILQSQTKTDKDHFSNDSSYPLGETDGGIAPRDKEKLEASLSEETKEESRDAPRENDVAVAEPAPVLAGTEQAGDSHESLPAPSEVPPVVEETAAESNIKEGEEEEEGDVVELQEQQELIPECSASNDSETAGFLSAAEDSISVAEAEAAADADAAAGPTSASDTLSTASAEVLPLNLSSKSQPPSTFSTSSPMMARRKVVTQTHHGAEDREKDRDREGHRAAPPPSPFMRNLAAASAGPPSSHSKEKTRQVASFLNPSPSIAFSKSMVTRGRHGSPSLGRRASVRTAVVAAAAAEEPEKDGQEEEEDPAADLSAPLGDSDDRSMTAEEDRPPSPSVTVELNVSESLLSEQEGPSVPVEVVEPAVVAVAEDVEATRIDVASGPAEIAETAASNPEPLLLPAGSGSADKSDGDASAALSCASSSSESTPARERLAKRLANMKKLSASSSPSSSLEFPAVVSEAAAPAAAAPAQEAASPASPPAVLRSSSSGDSRTATPSRWSAAKSPAPKRPKSPGVAVSRTASKSPSSWSATKTKVMAVSRSRSADSAQSASSLLATSSLGSCSDDQILVGLTAAVSAEAVEPSSNQGAEEGDRTDAGEKQLSGSGFESGAGAAAMSAADPGYIAPRPDAAATLACILSADTASMADGFDLLQASQSSSGDEFLLSSELLNVSSSRNSFHFPAAVVQPPPAMAIAPAPVEVEVEAIVQEAEADTATVDLTAPLAAEIEASEEVFAAATEPAPEPELEPEPELGPSPPDHIDSDGPDGEGDGEGGEEKGPAAAEAGAADVSPEKKNMSPVEVFLLGKASKKHTKRVPISSRYPPSPVPRIPTSPNTTFSPVGAGKKAAASASPSGANRALSYASPGKGSPSPSPPPSAIERIIVQKFPGVVESPPKDDEQRDDGSAAGSRGSNASSSRLSPSMGTRGPAAEDEDNDNRSVVSALSALSMRSGESGGRGRSRSNSNASSASKGPAASPKPIYPSPGAPAAALSSAARKEKEKAAPSPLSAKKPGMPPTPPQTHRSARKADGIADHAAEAPVPASMDDRSVVSMRSHGSSSSRAGSAARSPLPAPKAAQGRSPLPPSSSPLPSSSGRAASRAISLPPPAPQSAGRRAPAEEAGEAAAAADQHPHEVAESVSSNLPLSSPESAAVAALDFSDSEVGVTSLEDSDSVAVTVAAIPSMSPPPQQQQSAASAAAAADNIPKAAAQRRASLTQSKGSAEKKVAQSSSKVAGAAPSSKPKTAAVGATAAETKEKKGKAPVK